MDFSVILKGVKSLDSYINLTQDLGSKYSDTKIEFNLATLQCLKNIRSLEIEYFNKCQDTGAALIIVDKILQVPPSKSWSVLGTEVVFVIQYWLDAVRKHLIVHHRQWWSFLKHLLDFIKALIEKNSCFNNLLLEHMTDGLLDLATRGNLDINQRYEILHTLNLYSCKCSKKLRYAYKNQYEHYFVRLATIMANCGHVPMQYVIMETLLRWLVLRREQAARREAALQWLPRHLYRHSVIHLFVERSWQNFEQDTRDFLNMHNESGDLITSVLCKKLSVGNVVLVSGSERRQTWLDMNMATGCVTVLLVPGILYPLGISAVGCETLSIEGDLARSAKLFREKSEVTISILTDEPPQLLPSQSRAFGAAVELRAVVSARRTHMHRLDNALRAIFRGKYDVLLDFDNLPISPETLSDDFVAVNESEAFACLPKVRRSRHIGQIVKSCRPSWLGSPSSVSTSSLAQLHDKLDALPRVPFDKETVAVCESPDLSEVAELPEVVSSNTLNAVKHCDVITRRFNLNQSSQSDTEISKKNTKYVQSCDSDEKRSDVTQSFYISKTKYETPKNKNIDAIIDEDSTSCLLVTTIGSADHSVINDTLERLAKDTECRPDNIVDLLVKEALQAKPVDGTIDSGINTGDGKKNDDFDSEVIENTYEFTSQTLGIQNIESGKIGRRSDTYENKTFTVVSKSTSDESNTDAINEIPYSNVTVRRNKNQTRIPTRRQSVSINGDISAAPIITPQVVEDFFSLHCTEKGEDIEIISPTLAKKINETSSETSEEFDQCLMDNPDDIPKVPHEFPDVEVVECLNDVVDKVCSALDKYCDYIARNEVITDMSQICNTKAVETEDCNMSSKHIDEPKLTLKGKLKKTLNIKLKYKAKKRASKQQKANNKLILEMTPMSPIIEVHNEVSDKSLNSVMVEVMQKKSKESIKNSTIEKDSVVEQKNGDLETPLARRRRKLYSPKADIPVVSNKDNSGRVEGRADKSDDSNYDVILAKLKKQDPLKLKSNSSPALKPHDYSDIEKDRENYRILRSRKASAKVSTASPKTKKQNDMFDKLKENIENNEKITVVDKKAINKDIGVYNFTSDESEDEDFKKKKVDLQQRISNTTLESGISVMSTRRRARTQAKSNEQDISSEDNTKKATKRKTKLVKKKTSKTKLKDVQSTRDLEDERMRRQEKSESFNTSFLVEEGMEKDFDTENPQIVAPEPELIAENDHVEEKNKEIEKKNNNHTKETSDDVANKTNEDDRTISPLPGLVVEKENNYRKPDDFDDSLTTKLEMKLKKVYQEGPEALLYNNDTNTTQNLLSDMEKTNLSMPANEDYIAIADKYFGIEESSPDNNKYPYKTVSEMFYAPDKAENNLETIQERSSEENKTQYQLNDETAKDTSIDNRSTTSSKQRKYRSLQLKSRKYPIKSSDKNSQNKESKSKSPRNSREEKNFIRLNINKVSKISDLNKKTKSTPKSSQGKRTSSITIHEISDSDAGSDKSIPTVGITARGEIEGESDEEHKTLNEILIPRELADMEDSLKEYYVKLRAQINQLENSEVVSTKEPSKSQNSTENKATSPVVSVCRMPTQEVMQWISADKQQKTLKTNPIDDDIARYLPSRRNSDTDMTSIASQLEKSEKSLVVSLCRISPFEMKKWLSPKEESRDLSPLKLTSRKKTSTPEKRPERKSIISPVKLFEDIPKFRLSKINDEFATFTTKSSVNSPRLDKSPVLGGVTKRYFLRSSMQSTPNSLVSTSTKICRKLRPETPQKRRSPVMECFEVKRRKISVTLNKELSGESGQDVPSVKQWMTRAKPINVGPAMEPSTRDAVQLLIERLDTTLAEIHQNTTENFISLFINAQRQLNKMKEQRLHAQMQISERIVELQHVLAGVSADLVELDRKSKEMEEEFTDWFKRSAAGFLRSDCKRKRTMVSLLREDIEALFEYGDSQND